MPDGDEGTKTLQFKSFADMAEQLRAAPRGSGAGASLVAILADAVAKMLKALVAHRDHIATLEQRIKRLEEK